MRRVAAFLAALVVGVAPVAAPLTAAAQAQSLNYQGADIRVVAQDMSRLTGRSFIVDPRVSGGVTVVSNRALSRDGVFETFVAALRASGLVVAPAGAGAWRIAPAEDAARLAGSSGFVTEVFRLGSVDAASAAETLAPLVSAEGRIQAGGGNTLVVADYADNIRRIRDLLSRLDRDGSEVELVALENSSAREIAGVLDEALGLGGEGGSSLLTATAVDAGNVLVLRGERASVARARQLALDLDTRAAATGDVQVIPLQHADAEQLLPVLQQLAGQTPTPPAGDGDGPTPAGPAGAPPATASSVSGAPVTLARYPGSNAIIIAGNPAVRRTLAEVVRRLDTRRRQVLVEAIVVEVSDTAAQRLGVQMLIGGGDDDAIPFFATNYSGAGPNLLAIAGTALAEENLPEDSDVLDDLRSAAVNSIIGTTGVTFGGAGTLDSGALFGLVLNALRSDDASNLLSTPSLMTLDNETASLLVGQQIPIATGEVLGDSNSNPFRTISRQDVGVKLEVTPRINEGGAITLDLRQEVSAVAGPVSNAYQELIVNKREVDTTVLVDDGEIVVLGGLLSQEERLSEDGIPYLKDIPGLGALFRTRGRDARRTNLMIFLRPTIIGSRRDARVAAADRYRSIRDLERQASPDGRSRLEELVRDYLRTSPPDERDLSAPAIEAQPLPPPAVGAGGA